MRLAESPQRDLVPTTKPLYFSQAQEGFSPDKLTPIKASKYSLLGAEIDLDLRGRNCDRAIQWSPSFESCDEESALLIGYSLKKEL